MRFENVDVPKKLLFLYTKKSRYKGAYGGRGSAKSWSFARALLIKGANERLRILCAREIQKSIKQSVHALLEDQIDALGLRHKYEVLDTEIRGRNGTEINFTGIANHTVDSIKSYEGYDIVWVEEAQTVSKRSWDILIPTIRKEDSEIWLTFNPLLDTDDTYVRFVENSPPDSIVVKVNYDDNPHFPSVLEKERLHCQLTDPDNYDNIWGGECLVAVPGAIYAKQMAVVSKDQRICAIPYDPRLKVHAIWDLGWNDSMFIIFVQKIRSELRVIGCLEDDHRTLDSYVAELKSMNYNWGQDWLPHDGDHEDYKTGKSARQILKSFGRNVRITPNISIEDGIKAARMVIGQCYFDKVKSARLIECLKRYRRNVHTKTNEPMAPVHDEYSHGADAFRYLGLVADMLRNEEEQQHIPQQIIHQTVPGMGY